MPLFFSPISIQFTGCRNGPDHDTSSREIQTPGHPEKVLQQEVRQNRRVLRADIEGRSGNGQWRFLIPPLLFQPSWSIRGAIHTYPMPRNAWVKQTVPYSTLISLSNLQWVKVLFKVTYWYSSIYVLCSYELCKAALSDILCPRHFMRSVQTGLTRCSRVRKGLSLFL